MHTFHPRHRIPQPSNHGGVLVAALVMIAVISMMAAATLLRVGARHASTYQSASWNEAIASAEAGADFALLSLNNSLKDSSTAWAAWTPNDATTFPKTYTPAMPAHAGEGNTKVFASVVVDDSLTDADGQKWFRVRTTGVAELPSRTVSGIEAAMHDESGVKNHRSNLRRARFLTDITGGALRLPQVARTVELMAEPVGGRPFVRALTVKNAIAMSSGAYTDSFDSTDAASSSNGMYDATKRLSHGGVASNSEGGLSTLGNCYVFGDASSKGGALPGTDNVQGTVSGKFQATITEVARPVWSTIASSPTAISNPAGPVTLTGGPANAPVNYKLSELTVSNGSCPLILAPHANGQESHIHIWVTGKTMISGTGFIQQSPGVHVTIHCEDDVTISGGGIVNQTNQAANLQIFGVTPTSGTQNFTVSGGADFVGVVNAPAFAVNISGGGTFTGAVIAGSATISGNGSVSGSAMMSAMVSGGTASGSGGFHYDESLSKLAVGVPTSFQFASWVEDIR